MDKYKFGILTSLHDDYAVDLLQSINEAIESEQVDAQIPFVFCNKKFGESEKIDRRMVKIEGMDNMGDLITLSSKNFSQGYRGLKTESQKPKAKLETRDLNSHTEKWRMEYDRQVLTHLPKADSVLSVGYMHIITSSMYEQIDVVNIHPAIPRIGPVGMWPDVMEKQAKRALPYLSDLKSENLTTQIPQVMDISWLRAGGMLHIVTEKMDRGPVISWYEFPLIGEQINQLWEALVTNLRSTSLDELRKEPIWEKLIKEIRAMQFRGEEPLILSTYGHLTKGNWEIKDKTLYIDGEKYERGYCLNREIRKFLDEDLGAS